MQARPPADESHGASTEPKAAPIAWEKALAGWLVMAALACAALLLFRLLR